MNNLDNIKVEDMIYEIRGVQVMLDSDLAKIYRVETKRINEAVSRNKEKFPSMYSWLLTDEESNNFLVAICDQKKETRGGRYKNPRVFTEEGVYMLATILKSQAAIETTIHIIESFVKMRKYFANNVKILLNHENRLLVLEETFDKFKKKELNKIFFEGEFYDAYSIFLDILNSSKEEIIIIDNYSSKELLDIVRDIDKKILIVSKNIDEILKKKYESQYKNVSFIYNNSIHDRFIIIDRKILYTSGSSFKDIGKKCFYIGKIETQDNLSKLLNELNL